MLIEVNKGKTEREAAELYFAEELIDYDRYKDVVGKVDARLTHGKGEILGKISS